MRVEFSFDGEEGVYFVKWRGCVDVVKGGTICEREGYV